MILVSLLNVICSIFPHFIFWGVLFSDSFQCSQMCGGIYTLVDVVIANSTQANLVLCDISSYKVVTTMAT
jgi:hypothetical protein